MAGKVQLTVNWKFLNVVEGYDHDTKIIVSVDGKQAGTSLVSKQTDPGTFKIMVPKGSHRVLIQAYAFYEGKWEEHTIANNYSFDALFTGEIDFSVNRIVNLTFDIGTETVTSEVVQDPNGKSSVAATGESTLTVGWKFLNIVDGYDHESQLKVYIDGSLVKTSKVMKQSKKGTLTVKVPSGAHTVRLESWAYYQGTWEAHTIDNDYSHDAFYENDLLFLNKRKRTVQLVFDLDTAAPEVMIE
jgi:archaellum component FlaG (FlaF/FlaG flagellin family)